MLCWRRAKRCFVRCWPLNIRKKDESSFLVRAPGNCRLNSPLRADRVCIILLLRVCCLFVFTSNCHYTIKEEISICEADCPSMMMSWRQHEPITGIEFPDRLSFSFFFAKHRKLTVLAVFSVLCVCINSKTLVPCLPENAGKKKRFSFYQVSSGTFSAVCIARLLVPFYSPLVDTGSFYSC